MSAPAATTFDAGRRARLAAFADQLIPAAHGMPAASEVDVAGRQLDRVLAARADLGAPIVRALAHVDPDDAERSLAEVHEADPEAYDALLLAIVGGYYIHPEVRKRLGYTGQVPVQVRPEIIPNYVEQGLIDPVLERGAIYRRVPGNEEES
jgi:hypothetical protein